MKLKPFDAAKHSRAGDVPHYLWMAFRVLLTGRVRLAGRLAKLAGRVLLISLGLLTLSGCATKFVTVPCLTREQLAERQKAEPPKIHDQLTGDASRDIKPIAGSAVELRAWGRGNLDILGGCVA